jgi:hypothetical protein
MSCPSTYAFNKDNTNFFPMNLLRIKIFDPEQLNHKRSVFDPIPNNSIMLIEKAHNLHKIYEEGCRRRNSYTSPYVRTCSYTNSEEDAQRQKDTENYQKGYMTAAYNQIRKEFVKIVENCKNVLIEYDMLEEFKKYNPSVSIFFDFKENDFTDEIISKHNIIDSNSNEFIRGTIMCALSYEAEDKMKTKVKLQKELREKKENQKKEQIYKREFTCMKLFDEIDKNKMKSSELYVEYKKILELKQQYKPTGEWIYQNTQFVDYFTSTKQKQLTNLIAKCNPILLTNEINNKENIVCDIL